MPRMWVGTGPISSKNMLMFQTRAPQKIVRSENVHFVHCRGGFALCGEGKSDDHKNTEILHLSNLSDLYYSRGRESEIHVWVRTQGATSASRPSRKLGRSHQSFLGGNRLPSSAKRIEGAFKELVRSHITSSPFLGGESVIDLFPKRNFSDLSQVAEKVKISF